MPALLTVTCYHQKKWGINAVPGYTHYIIRPRLSVDIRRTAFWSQKKTQGHETETQRKQAPWTDTRYHSVSLMICWHLKWVILLFQLCTQFKEAAIFWEALVIQGRLLLSGHVTMCLHVPLVPKWTEVQLFSHLSSRNQCVSACFLKKV